MSSRQRSWARARLGSHLGKLALVALGFALAWLLLGRAPRDPHVGHEHASHPAAEASVWTCSMHPQVRHDEAGSCPICGMDLIPVATPPSESTKPPAVVLSERARTLARIRTTPVTRQGHSGGALRLLGRLEPNETTLRSVTAWTGGRIDRLHVSATGERVRAGQVIATLYSPEVFHAHQDLLVARRQVERLAMSPESSRQAAQAALAAARERLALLGMPDRELARMEKLERPSRAVAIRSPFAGTILERTATEGAYVETGAPLYALANLQTLWVQLDAYESDLAQLEKGQRVLVRVDALPGEDFEGKVAFIDPTLDPQRRTLRVRVEVVNRDGRLRPGMFATARVQARAPSGEEPLVVPASAPLFTGRRALVYVEVERGELVGYEPRNVRLGARLGNFYPVISGLSEGERVVSRGAFVVDADLQIRGGPSMMAEERTTRGEDAGPDTATASGTESHEVAP